jgi:hypothetical protein
MEPYARYYATGVGQAGSLRGGCQPPLSGASVAIALRTLMPQAAGLHLGFQFKLDG